MLKMDLSSQKDRSLLKRKLTERNARKLRGKHKKHNVTWKMQVPLRDNTGYCQLLLPHPSRNVTHPGFARRQPKHTYPCRTLSSSLPPESWTCLR